MTQSRGGAGTDGAKLQADGAEVVPDFVADDEPLPFCGQMSYIALQDGGRGAERLAVAELSPCKGQGAALPHWAYP